MNIDPSVASPPTAAKEVQDVWPPSGRAPPAEIPPEPVSAQTPSEQATTDDHAEQSPPLLQEPSTPRQLASPPQWFKSPPPKTDSQTGRVHPSVLSVQMQRMVLAELTDQTEWYEGDPPTPPPAQVLTSSHSTVAVLHGGS